MKQNCRSATARRAAQAALSALCLGLELCACTNGAAGIAAAAPATAEFRLPEWQEDIPVWIAPSAENDAEGRAQPAQEADASVRAALVQWNIEAVCGKNRREFRALPTDAAVRLEVGRNEACAVLARPVVRIEYAEPPAEPADGGGAHAALPELLFFRPCGAVYPFQTELSWQDGFAASCLSDFYAYALRSGVPEDAAVRHASCFNWTKFSSSLALKGAAAEAFYNPWQLDRNAILAAIAARSFSVTLLAQKKSCAVASEQLAGSARFVAVSSYIPQNEAAWKSGTFTLKESVPEEFLLLPRGGISGPAEGGCGAQEAMLLAAEMPSAAKAQQITLALKSIPIYTEAQ
ncbi:MAG: hypothetical protein K2H09_03835 [Treponemataceae bacterium]|nr:hypothetical protein [Treponemataceae bacterium]